MMFRRILIFASCCWLICQASTVFSQTSSQSPMADAVALWHMGDLSDASENGHSLTAFGSPAIGESLSDDEKFASFMRGGDGKVATLKAGDYFSVAQADSLNITGRELTIYMRLQVPSGRWDFPIFAKHGGHEQLAYNIYASKDRIGCEVGTTKNKGFMSATVPFSELLPPGHGAETWHDVICRVDGAKLELFVDGRCVDEEFMLGDLRINAEPLLIGAESYGANFKAGFEGLIDHIVVWDRALSHNEIVVLGGGPEEADLRERTDRGIPGESLQYWRPPNNYYVGDCLPFYQDGVFHFAYLLDKGHHRAKAGYGAHQWVQATSTDLKTWQHQPFLVPVTEQWEGSICTGSVFYHDGIYYAFYATRAVPEFPAPDGKSYSGEYVAYATSTDGIRFTKQEPNPLVVLPHDAGYSRAGRDPVVFQDERDGLFHMYITSSYKGQGCWAHLTSSNLKNWDLQLPVLAGGGDPECPDWFKWGDTYYLIVNWGNGFYRTSATPTGPWDKPNTPDILMPGAPRVPKTAAYHDDRRIICGWTNENGFGGHAVFHELIRYSDGTLGEKFVPEMIPATDEPVLTVTNHAGESVDFSNLPKEYRLQMTLTFDKDKVDSQEDWRMIYHRDASQKLTVGISPKAKRAWLGNTELQQVDFSEGRITFDLIIKNRVIDLCIGDKRTITGIIPDYPVRELVIENPSWAYTIESLVVSPIAL